MELCLFCINPWCCALMWLGYSLVYQLYGMGVIEITLKDMEIDQYETTS